MLHSTLWAAQWDKRYQAFRRSSGLPSIPETLSGVWSKSACLWENTTCSTLFVILTAPKSDLLFKFWFFPCGPSLSEICWGRKQKGIQKDFWLCRQIHHSPDMAPPHGTRPWRTTSIKDQQCPLCWLLSKRIWDPRARVFQSKTMNLNWQMVSFELRECLESQCQLEILLTEAISSLQVYCEISVKFNCLNSAQWRHLKWCWEMMKGPECVMQELPQIPPQTLISLNTSILSNHIAKHMNYLRKIILISTVFNKSYKQSCETSPFAPLQTVGSWATSALLRGGGFLHHIHPPIPIPESLSLSLFSGTGSVWAGPRGEQPAGWAIPASCRVPAPYRRWPGRGSLLGLPWATLPAANRNLQQC